MNAVATEKKNESEALEKLKKLVGESREIKVSIDDVFVNRSQNTRADKSYTDESMNLMKEQIRATGGILSPILVYAIDPSPVSDNKPYCLLAGYRRTLALIELASEPGGEHFGKNIPAVEITGEHGETAQTAIQLLENVGRQDLNPMEQSNGIAEMLKDKSVTQKSVAQFFGWSEVQVSNLLKLQQLPNEIQDLISEDKISFSAARVLVRDVPESSWPEYAKFAAELPYGEFMKKVESLKQAQAATTDGDKAEGDAASASKDQQRRTELVKASQLKESYIPFLQKKLEEAKADTEKKFTAADIVNARMDTVNAIMMQKSSLGEAIKPFLQEQILAKEAEAKNKEANTAEEKFYRDLIKETEELYKRESKPDLNNPSKQFTLAMAIATTLQRVVGLDATAVEKLGFPFDVKNTEHIKKRFTEVYKQVTEERADAQKKKLERDAKKAEEEAKAKAKADEDAKAAATTAAAAG
jgi:ParB/RepB/Spo0J family partition protein